MLISYNPDLNCSSGVGSGGGSFDISGSGTEKLTGGGIFVNSDEVCGFLAPNCPNLQITGEAGINSTANVDNIAQQDCTAKTPPINPVPENLNQNPVIIPEDINWPNVPVECDPSKLPTATYLGVDPSDGKGEWLISPGYYEVFPQSTLVANKQHIYMKSGVYCIDPGGPTKDFDRSMSILPSLPMPNARQHCITWARRANRTSRWATMTIS